MGVYSQRKDTFNDECLVSMTNTHADINSKELFLGHQLKLSQFLEVKKDQTYFPDSLQCVRLLRATSTHCLNCRAENCPLYHIMSHGSCQISPSNPLARSLPDREECFSIHVGVKLATARLCKMRVSKTRCVCVCVSE